MHGLVALSAFALTGLSLVASLPKLRMASPASALFKLRPLRAENLTCL